MRLFPQDWLRVFAPETALLELVARGSVLYLAILVLMRMMLRRSSGELAMIDLLFVLLLAEAATHAFNVYTSVTDALVVIATIMGWNYLLNFLSYHMPLVERLVTPPPLQVIRDGRFLRRNMRREFLTEEELMHQLRQQGVEDVKDVRAAYIEEGGSLSVVRGKGNR